MCSRLAVLAGRLYQIGSMDELDLRLIAALRSDARRSISDLARDLGVGRATLRARLERLLSSGQILGFTVVLKDDQRDLPIRAVMLVGIEGKRAEAVTRSLAGMPEVRNIHTTNGRWDLVIEIATGDLTSFDDALRRIRLIDGIAATETNLLLATRKTPSRPQPRSD